MECNVPFSLLEPHHCDLTGKTFNDSQTTSPTPSAKRQRKEKTQKEREKRARRDTASTSAQASESGNAVAAATAAAAASEPPVNGFAIKEEMANAAATTSEDGNAFVRFISLYILIVKKKSGYAGSVSGRHGKI